MRTARLAVMALGALLACRPADPGDERRADTGGRDVGTSAALPAPPVGFTVETIRVNGGTHGMRASLRWLLSPDRHAILVVEDPVSVEAEALPDAFVYASEATGAVVQMDSVWDVAPSPDWTRLAFGRAYVLRAGERDTVPESEWKRLEAQLPEDVAMRDSRSLRRALEAHAFPASGMSVMLGLGLAQVLWVDGLADGRAAAPTGPTHSLNGWRVRWTRGGDTLGVGAAPRAVQDDAPPSRWTLVRPRRWAVFSDTLGGTGDSSSFVSLRWAEGPTMELASPLAPVERRPIAIDRGTIEAREGTIRVLRRSAGGGGESRVVGPGIPLAATSGGRFILALVPRAGAPSGEMPAEAVVYHVRSQ